MDADKVRETAKLISIHAPRGGSDQGRVYQAGQAQHFNPRSPRGERLTGPDGPMKKSQFQSTLPAGGATINAGTGGRGFL